MINHLARLLATAFLLAVQPAVAQTTPVKIPPPTAPTPPRDRPLHGISIPEWLPTYPVTITHAIQVPTRGPTAQGVREQTITAMLFRPDRPGPIPAAVIVNSSGGIDGDSELAWAAYLAELGVATLVLDSFTPRGIRRTVHEQSLDRLWSSQDGAAGWRWLAGQNFVQRDRILISGMSRGGTAAVANAVEEQRLQMQSADARFAAHVAISPNCSIQQRNARSTGAPILFMLGELDDYSPIHPCLDYAKRLRAAGNHEVRTAIYAGGFHAPETSWGSGTIADVQPWKKCVFFRHTDGAAFDLAGTSVTISSRQLGEYAAAHCSEPGGSVGGDMRLRRQMGADLLRFLMQYGFVVDSRMQAALPDCATVPEAAGMRRSCQRAAWGWNAEAGRLAAAFAQGASGISADASRALALARVAAERGEPNAQTLLATWLRQGSMGVTRDPETARRFAERAAAQGHGGADNELGVLAEQEKDVAGARAAFQRAAERYNSYGMANFGQALATGLGGPPEPAEAERWLRLAIHYENPLGSLYLARALEAGQLGRPADQRAALEAYRAAAATSFSGQAEARRAVARLEAAGAKR